MIAVIYEIFYSHCAYNLKITAIVNSYSFGEFVLNMEVGKQSKGKGASDTAEQLAAHMEMVPSLPHT